MQDNRILAIADSADVSAATRSTNYGPAEPPQMRKQPKSFTVEVKRRPSSLTRKPGLAEAPVAAPQPPAAAVVFASAGPAPAAAAESQRRILPCLVTEAAIDAAKAVEESQAAPAPRPRGRPRKQRSQEELAPLAPRKRGRPRKIPLEAKEPKSQSARAPAAKPVRQPAPAAKTVRQPAPAAPVALVVASARASSRRTAVGELPRGERWKRRLPKALR